MTLLNDLYLQLLGNDPTAASHCKVEEKYIYISSKHLTEYACTTHQKARKIEAILCMYMVSFGKPDDLTAKLFPKLLLGCATSKDFQIAMVSKPPFMV